MPSSPLSPGDSSSSLRETGRHSAIALAKQQELGREQHAVWDKRVLVVGGSSTSSVGAAHDQHGGSIQADLRTLDLLGIDHCSVITGISAGDAMQDVLDSEQVGA